MLDEAAVRGMAELLHAMQLLGDWYAEMEHILHLALVKESRHQLRLIMGNRRQKKMHNHQKYSHEISITTIAYE